MVKLYELFSQVRSFRSLVTESSWEGNPMVEKTMEILHTQFGCNPLANFVDYKASDILLLGYLRARRNLVEKDLYSFQSEAYKVNAKLCKFVKNAIKEACVDQHTQEFLYETLTVILNWNHPVVEVLNRQIDLATDFLMKYWDPDISDTFLIESGLSKYHMTKGTFSMRSSVSILLAESAILKEFLSVAKNLQNVKSEDYIAIRERISALESNTQ